MTTFLVPARSDTLPENTRYKDDGCDVSPACLECPLPLCKYDDPGWMERESKRVRDDSIYRAKLAGDSVSDIALRFGVSPRTVHRVIKRGGAEAGAQPEEDDTPLLSLKELEQRSLFRPRTPAPPLFGGVDRYRKTGRTRLFSM